MRCDSCGNKTRFDVFESKRVRSFHHYTLGGELSVEEEEILDHDIEKVVCRWCGSSESIVRSEVTEDLADEGVADQGLGDKENA